MICSCSCHCAAPLGLGICCDPDSWGVAPGCYVVAPFGAESQWVFTNTTLLLTHLPRLFDHELQLLNSHLTLLLRRQAVDQL